MSSSKRHFTAVVGSKENGLYISSSPSSAARKIVSKLCAASKSKKVEFCVREITQGSKKKTYGPYLGEMKKLVKPIELKGRVIRYAPVVHLKKKKTAIKTAKKIGKKMRGGTITDGGELDETDFIIYDKLEYESIAPCRLTRKQDRLQEPFIFFGKIIDVVKDPFGRTICSIMHYEYVAFNEGLFQKTAKFNEFYIKSVHNYTTGEYEPKYIINSDFTIDQIPRDALRELKEFIEQQRKNNPSFCKTIYNAVSEELSLRDNYNTKTSFVRRINRIVDNKKKIKLIQQHKQGEYRQLLVSINGIKEELSAPANHGYSRETYSFSQQNERRKNDLRVKLNKLVRNKEEIELKYSIFNN
jgi:hypothetical protein